ncbi:PfkB family carbohydrate kinase [Neoaquamicrobium sediminum]|uniref:PfkB family carbohydrate kinase n=1 Tax=Neoaquamicrobium sediminum TaxID=1849104 RepID=A0ABV3X1P3_9HYPH
MSRTAPRILAFGDNVVDCYRDQNRMFPGGNCVNHAVFARRFGAETAYAGAVSDDPAGHAIRDAFLAEGVETSLLRLLPGQTAFCVIATQGGERVFVGANLGVSIIAPSPADLAWMKTVDAVHTGRSSHVDAWLAHFASLTRVSYDFATIRDVDRIAAVAPHCFLAGFSGGGMTRGEARTLAATALHYGARWAVITRGGDGALLAGPDGIYEAPAVPVQPVDTLGAGDTFIACTLVGLLRNEAPEAILRAAAEAAAQTCLSPGAFGYAAPMMVDLSSALTIEEIYARTRAVPGPEVEPAAATYEKRATKTFS